jgi:hypothetical protein
MPDSSYMFPGKQLSARSNFFFRDLQTKEANVSRETFASFSYKFRSA